jgi:hypothetical protein
VPRRVFLHVGLPKSGTTYLQGVVDRNKALLLERAALLYPGETWSRQVDATRDVLRPRLLRPKGQVVGAWGRLVAEIADWPDDSLVSMEWLCQATPRQVRRIVDDLQPAEVHVVFTVRDVARTVPAAWQEFSQNGAVWRWPEFLEQVTSADPLATSAGRAFWHQQDMELLLERWGAVVPADRVHVVTVPQSGADPAELWRRFAGVLGIDPHGYDLAELGSNSSLGMESAELMRRVNVRLRDEGITRRRYNRVFKHRLAKNILATRRAQEGKVLLPTDLRGWAEARAAQQVRAISASGVRVVGDLAELAPAPPRSGVGAPTAAVEPDPEAVLDAAVDALVAVALRRRRRRRTAARRARGRLHGLREARGDVAGSLWTTAVRGVRGIGGRVASLHRPRG